MSDCHKQSDIFFSITIASIHEMARVYYLKYSFLKAFRYKDKGSFLSPLQ